MASAKMIAEGSSEKIEDQGKNLHRLVSAYSAKKLAKIEGTTKTLILGGLWDSILILQAFCPELDIGLGI